MHIRVLGPIDITAGDREIRLAGQRQRALLAALVLDHGKVVPVARLVDALWDGCPPATARTKIHAHVSALRHAFGDHGTEMLTTCAPGYMLRDVDVDLIEFKTLTSRGMAAAASRDPAAASGHLAAALALWRGRPFADVASALITDAAAGIEERRLLTMEAKAEADLALGRPDVVAAQLGEWLGEYPLRERLRALLMLALCRLGCRAEALTLYRDGRQAIVDELGLEPGPELRNLHQRILAEQPGRPAERARPAARPRAPILRTSSYAYSSYSLTSEMRSRI